jgi:hypothetical protein
VPAILIVFCISLASGILLVSLLSRLLLLRPPLRLLPKLDITLTVLTGGASSGLKGLTDLIRTATNTVSNITNTVS